MINTTPRLFTFGCSLTNYHWPTWADILGYEYEHYNWGMIGLGNLGIFLQLIEAGRKHKINKNDKVVIMWTYLGRENRYVKDKWLVTGSVFRNTVYDNNWIKKYYCDRGNLIKELGAISAAVDVLNQWECDWKFLTANEIIGEPVYNSDSTLNVKEILNNYQDFLEAVDNGFTNLKTHRENLTILNTYNHIFKITIKPCLLTSLLLKYNTDVPEKLKYHDSHPTPRLYLEYVKTVFPQHNISKECEDWVNYWNLKVLDSSSPNELGWKKEVNRF